MAEFTATDYVPTEFACESCGDPLHRIVPSTLLTCTNWGCDNGEVFFLVEPA